MKPAGIYIHIPFCRSRCSYCDFATGMYSADLAERYVLSLAKEIAAFTSPTEPPEIDTIYFGGGTPSMLSPGQLETLLNAVHRRFTVSANPEVTIEINPGSVTPESLEAFRSLGFNRASFGVQTFDDHELARLGRSHSANDFANYHHRMEAVNYSLSHDDGVSTRDLAEADIILVGVSRCGKTPDRPLRPVQFRAWIHLSSRARAGRRSVVSSASNFPSGP